jgi:hypothetical protein
MCCSRRWRVNENNKGNEEGEAMRKKGINEKRRESA